LEARSGDIVIAYIEDEGFTIKRIFFQNSTVILQASNPAFPPIVVQPGIQEIRIIGKVIMHIGFH
jgi:SOS-response transcriptional repressor LexA